MALGETWNQTPLVTFPLWDALQETLSIQASVCHLDNGPKDRCPHGLHDGRGEDGYVSACSHWHNEQSFHTASVSLPIALWPGTWPVAGEAPSARGNEV